MYKLFVAPKKTSKNVKKAKKTREEVQRNETELEAKNVVIPSVSYETSQTSEGDGVFYPPGSDEEKFSSEEEDSEDSKKSDETDKTSSSRRSTSQTSENTRKRRREDLSEDEQEPNDQDDV
ncbi:9685_t:CDS:2, partial [Dentiscutata heterogama]